MSRHSETPFDNIESSHEYVRLLAEAITVALSEVEADIALAGADIDGRRKEALQLAVFKLNKLASHMTASGRILNDLRSLRRLLLEERSLPSINDGATTDPDVPHQRRFVAAAK
jgi:hypothetical protein